MKGLTVFVAACALLAGLACTAFAAGPSTNAITPDQDAPAACHRKAFKTELVKAACAKGGQKAAKAAMKRWVKANKDKAKEAGEKLNCATCHSKMKEDFPLKAKALDIFKRYNASK